MADFFSREGRNSRNDACMTFDNAGFPFQYSTLLFVVFVGEVLLLLFAYHLRQSVDSAFHDGLSRGLAEYGKDYERTDAVDELQANVRANIELA